MSKQTVRQRGYWIKDCILRKRTYKHIGRQKCWLVFICGKNQAEVLNIPKFDFTGKKFHKNVIKLSQHLQEQYGITQKELESAIVTACAQHKINPPKYLKN